MTWKGISRKPIAASYNNCLSEGERVKLSGPPIVEFRFPDQPKWT